MKVINRIKASDDFALAIKKGRAQRNQSYVIHIRPNEFNYVRVGISVSSKLGNAVVRNLVILLSLLKQISLIVRMMITNNH